MKGARRKQVLCIIGLQYITYDKVCFQGDAVRLHKWSRGVLVVVGGGGIIEW